MVIEQVYSEKEVKNILSDYFWMINEIQRINHLLDDTNFSGTAQYGIEATLPKPQGLTNDAMANEIARRDKKSRRKMRMLHKIEYVQNRIQYITDERQKVVLDCLLDGMSVTAISKHMGLSRKHIHVLRNKIVDEMMKY